ncbi:unnamed protein product [Sympodiomycopsis kandeliae]
MSSDTQTLDLSLLRSYSPEWSPELRLALCIAVKYACHRLARRYEACDSKQTDQASTKTEGKVTTEWAEYSTKFITATCQHLGVSQAALPDAAQIYLQDTLDIALGMWSDDSQEADNYRRSEKEAIQVDQQGSETGSPSFRRERLQYLLSSNRSEADTDTESKSPPRILRSDVATERQLINPVIAKEDQQFDEQVLETVRQKRHEQQHAGQEEAAPGDSQAQPEKQDPTLEPAPTEEEKAAAAFDDLSPSENEEELQLPSATANHARKGGCLVDPETGDIDAGKEFEVLNDLLLIALGLGQYRSTDDGQTTLFESEILFADEAQQKPSNSAPSPPSQSSDPVSSSSASPWSAVKSTASSSWNWTASASKKSGQYLADKSAEIRGQAPGTTATAETSSSKGKPAQPVKPNEICHYDARARSVLFVAAGALGIRPLAAWQAEKAMAQTIFFLMNEARDAAKKAGKEDPLSHVTRADEDSHDRGEEEESLRTRWMNKMGGDSVESHGRSNWKKWAVAGSGFAIGGAIIGLTGGLAAPLVVPTLAGLTGVTFLATSGGIIMLGTLFGVAGGGLASYRVHRRLRGLDSFEFRPLTNATTESGLKIPSLQATICCSGLILSPEQQSTSWQEAFHTAPGSRDIYTISSEAALMTEAGRSLRSYLGSELLSAMGKTAGKEVIKKTTLSALTALTLPLTVAGMLSRSLDSLFIRAKNQSQKQGLILADVIRKEVQGHRPVILVGTSLGAVTILNALLELSNSKHDSHAHLIDSVYLIATPYMTPSRSVLNNIRKLVANRFVNVYSRNDMVCSIATWSSLDINAEHTNRLPQPMGSRPIWDVPGLENVDVSDLVQSHFALCDASVLHKVLSRAGSLHG